MIKNEFVTSFLHRHRMSGMTMTEMMVVMVLIGMAALGVASLSGNMATSSKKIQGMVGVDGFATSLNAYLYSAAGCNDVKTFGALNTQPKDVVLTGWTYQGMNRFEGGKHSNGTKKTLTKNFEIDSLQAYLVTDANPARIKDSTGADLTKSVLKFRARLKVGNKPSEYMFNIPVLVTGGGVVSYCADEKNLAETCAAAQGQYNPATKQCDLGSTCKIKDTWNRLTCSPMDNPGKSGWSCSPIFGASKVNQYTSGFTCPSGSVEMETQSTTWVSKRDCGKKCTQSIRNNMVWKVCLECPGT